MSENAPKQQFQLRVKPGSRLDAVMELMRSGDYIPKDDLIEAATVKDIWWLLHAMSDWFDNMTLDFPFGKNTARMTYVAPRTQQVVQHIHEANFDGASPAPSNTVDELGEVVWPDAPAFLDAMDNFDPPEYFETLRTVVASGRHVSLSGPPGIGKSTSVEQLAAQENKILINIGAEGGLSKRDLVGTPELINGTSKVMVAEFAAAVVNGWWVKIDEINAADPDAILQINSVLAPPYIINIHGRQYPVHPDFRLFVTYNRNVYGLKPLPSSFKDRFFPIYLEFPSAYRLRRLLERNGLPDRDHIEYGRVWPDTIVKFGVDMWQAHVDGKMRYQISPRRLMDASFLIMSETCTDVKTALEMAVINVIDSDLERRAAKEVLNRV